MTLKTSTEFFHEVHDPFQEHFVKNTIYSFHNLLWQLIVNEIHPDKLVILYPVYTDKLQLSIVWLGERGHLPTHVEFVKGTTFEQACEIADKLNEMLFGVLPLLGDVIVMQSMRKDKKEDAMTYKVVCNINDKDFYSDDKDRAYEVFNQYKDDYGDGIRLYHAARPEAEDEAPEWEVLDYYDEGDDDWEAPEPETKVFRAMEGGTDGG